MNGVLGLILHCNAILSRKTQGLMRWILLWNEPCPRCRYNLDLLICSPNITTILRLPLTRMEITNLLCPNKWKFNLSGFKWWVTVQYLQWSRDNDKRQRNFLPSTLIVCALNILRHMLQIVATTSVLVRHWLTNIQQTERSILHQGHNSAQNSSH